MTKLNFDKLLPASLTAALLLTILVPEMSLAKTASQATPAGVPFCSRIAQYALQIDQNLANRQAKLHAAQQNRLTNLQNRDNNNDTKLADLRKQWDQNRDQQFAKLEARATTDAQKQAVQTFETTIRAAITARRSAIDAAIETFRTGLAQVLTQRQTKVATAISSFQTSVDAAINKAKSDCGSGMDPKTVRAAFIASLKTARTQFQTDRQAIDKLATNVQPLVTARRTAIEAAVQTFKTAAEQARTALKTAFGET